MKKIALVLVLLSMSLLAQPEWLDSLDEAKDRALKEDKLIMLMLSREECNACWYMENVVLEEKDVNMLLKSKFVSVYLNIREDDVPEKFPYVGTPTFYFIDAQGNIIGKRQSGALNTKEFVARLAQVLHKSQELKK
jgi:thioredoxin-related protein